MELSHAAHIPNPSSNSHLNVYHTKFLEAAIKMNSTRYLRQRTSHIFNGHDDGSYNPRWQKTSQCMQGSNMAFQKIHLWESPWPQFNPVRAISTRTEAQIPVPHHDSCPLLHDIKKKKIADMLAETNLTNGIYHNLHIYGAYQPIVVHQWSL